MVTDHDTTKIIAICNETRNLIAFIIVVSKMGTWSVTAQSIAISKVTLICQ